MNIFKTTLDTRHQNGVIGPITQFDNATLELQILTGGQVTEPWDSPEFELIAMKRDMNPVREVEQDRFTILSKEDHKVRIELKEQFLTCRGMVKMQLVIKDGSRLSTTIFRLSIGQSLDATIIESLKDIKVLDDLDEVVESLTTLEVTATNNEAKRQENEKLREVAESNRQDEFEQAQNQRDTDFNEKMEEYQDYVSANEETRQKNEELRELAESNRQDEFSKAQSQRDTEFNNKMEEFQEHVSKLEGEKGEQGETPQIRVNETHIQVKYPSEQEWFDLIALEMLRGRQGLQGLQGEALQIQTNETHIQFKYPSQQKWTDLIALESLRGLQGIQGEQGYSGVFIGKPEDAPASANLVIDDDMTDYELLIADANRDYMGNDHDTLRQAANANVDYAIRTAVGEFNYLAYEGQTIKATNTIEGHAKSAVLKGQTLVNHLSACNLKITSNNNYTVPLSKPMDTNKKYLLKFKINSLPTFNDSDNRVVKLEWYSHSNSGGYYNFYKRGAVVGKEEYVIIQPFNDEVLRTTFIARSPSLVSGTLDIDIMIIEYQDGMENWDIPYFEGMSSVESPVVTSVGNELSHTITSTEEVILRSLPNGVCDTLNLLTEEHIQRIGEVEVDLKNSRYSWLSSDGMAGQSYFVARFENMKKAKGVTGLIPSSARGNILPIDNPYGRVTDSCCGVYLNEVRIYIPNFTTKEEYVTWLSSNRLVIVYELATPIIKRVKLSHNEVYSYNGITTYNCRSEVEGSLIPTLAVTVPTNIQEVIQAERQKNIELSEAQDVLIEYQLQMYEQRIMPLDLHKQEMPFFVQKLYELAYKRGIRVREEVEADVDVR